MQLHQNLKKLQIYGKIKGKKTKRQNTKKVIDKSMKQAYNKRKTKGVRRNDKERTQERIKDNVH